MNITMAESESAPGMVILSTTKRSACEKYDANKSFVSIASDWCIVFVADMCGVLPASVWISGEMSVACGCCGQWCFAGKCVEIGDNVSNLWLWFAGSGGRQCQ